MSAIIPSHLYTAHTILGVTITSKIAAINNLVLGILARLGYTRAPQARRHFAMHVDEAVNVVLQSLY